jgi:hypothetical protein
MELTWLWATQAVVEVLIVERERETWRGMIEREREDGLSL